MNSQKKPKSRQEILRQQQQSAFVGREEQLAAFRYNLAMSPDNWCFLLNIWGQGGAGKSTLLRQFRKIADGADFVTAYTNEAETSVPEAMGRLTEQLEQKGWKLGQFSERYKTYRQKKQELEADPEAPQSFSAFFGRSLAKAGLGFVKQTPGSAAVTAFLDEEAIATQASEWASYVAKRLSNKDEVRLIQEPVEVLTPLFLQELSELANRKNLILFFDTYERTSIFLDDWFHEILEGRYGDLPTNIMLVIAGREELDKNRWIDYEGAIARLALNPFTEDEVKQYLLRKGITNPQIVDAIIYLSGRLPLLVATLASESPTDPQQIGDASGTAVERFLKWVDDPQRRKIALDAALPRILNQDIIAVLQGEDTASTLFEWLKQMPFVEERLHGWTYHDIARTQMLRHKKLTSPQSWANVHRALADYYEKLSLNLLTNDEKHWLDPIWQNYALNCLYHRLCQMSQQYLPVALNEFATLLKTSRRRVFGLLYIETLCQAAKDVESLEIQSWGAELNNGLRAYGEDRFRDALKMLADLIEYPKIEVVPKSVAISLRGEVCRFLGQYENAIDSLSDAIEIDPNDYYSLADRAETWHLLKNYEKALEDFDRAIQLNPKYIWAIIGRGYNYMAMKRFEDARKDFELAVNLAPEDKSAIAGLGETYRYLKCYEKALENLSRAINYDSNFACAFSWRGDTYRLMERYEEAIDDFDRAIKLEPNNAEMLAGRGQTYQIVKRYEEALRDLNHSIELNPQLDWAIARRGEIYQALERYEEALGDFNRAIELNPQFDWATARRGEIYQAMGCYEEALIDLNRAIELNPQFDWAIARREEIYQGWKVDND